MLRLKSIRLAGWKSIRDMDPPLELRAVNVLIGANGSGKSNLVEFFKLLGAMVDGRLVGYVARAGGLDALLHFGVKQTKEVRAELEAQVDEEALRFTVTLSAVVPSGLLVSSEKVGERKEAEWTARGFSVGLAPGVHPGLAREPRLLDLLSDCRVFHFHDTSGTSAMRQEHYIERNQRLDADGGNLAAMLYRYQQMQPVVYRRIVRTVRLFAPFFDDFVLEPRQLNPRNILLNWRAKGHDHEFGPHQFSDGTLRLIALCTLLLQPQQEVPALILLDEPELGLHPAALTGIAGLIHGASLHAQVIVATQSAAFLDHFELDQVVVVNRRAGESTFRRLRAEEYRSWLDEDTLSDLWERNVIGAGPYS